MPGESFILQDEKDSPPVAPDLLARIANAERIVAALERAAMERLLTAIEAVGEIVNE